MRNAVLRSPGSQAAATHTKHLRRSASARAGEAVSSRTFDLGDTAITSFELPSEETTASPARARAAARRVAGLRLYRHDHFEQASQPGSAWHAEGRSRFDGRSSWLVDVSTQSDGSSQPVPAGTIALVDLHPDLATGLTAAELKAVRNALLLPVVRVHGCCDISACAEAVEAHGLLGAVVTDGLLVGKTRVAGHVAAQIYGPGDLLNGNREPDGSLATAQALHAPVPTSLAVLDDRFLAAMRRWPRLAAEFFTQAMRQVDRAGEHQGISQLTRVEDRLLALFWYLADRWGRVRPDGVTIDLPLTHEMIGRLIGARRPTVSLGLRDLARQDLLRREPDGRWLLAAESLPRVNGEHPQDGRYPSPVGAGAGVS